MSTLTLNIETVPAARGLARPYPREGEVYPTDRKPPSNYKDPEKIAAWHLKDEADWYDALAKGRADWATKCADEASLSPLYGRILCVGFERNDLTTFSADPLFTPDLLWAENEREEADLITRAFAFIDHSDRLVTFNGLTFDLPFLMIRAMALGVPWRGRTPFRAYLTRYNTTPHYDVRAVLSNWDNRASGTLDDWAQFIGFPPKETSGADVWAAYQRGDLDYIGRECTANLERTTALYERLTAFGRT